MREQVAVSFVGGALAEHSGFRPLHPTVFVNHRRDMRQIGGDRDILAIPHSTDPIAIDIGIGRRRIRDALGQFNQPLRIIDTGNEIFDAATANLHQRAARVVAQHISIAPRTDHVAVLANRPDRPICLGQRGNRVRNNTNDVASRRRMVDRGNKRPPLNRRRNRINRDGEERITDLIAIVIEHRQIHQAAMLHARLVNLTKNIQRDRHTAELLRLLRQATQLEHQPRHIRRRNLEGRKGNGLSHLYPHLICYPHLTMELDSVKRSFP